MVPFLSLILFMVLPGCDTCIQLNFSVEYMMELCQYHRNRSGLIEGGIGKASLMNRLH
jgi:hypothetical protein